MLGSKNEPVKFEEKRIWRETKKDQYLEKRAPEIEKQKALEEDAEFSIIMKEALNKPQFAEFLAQFPDGQEVILGKNRAKLEERYETFKIKEKVSGEMKKMYQDEILKDTGISLSDADLEAVDKFLNKKAFEDPAGITKLREQIDTYREFPRRIAAKEAELQQLMGGEQMEDINKYRKNLEVAQGMREEVGLKKDVNWSLVKGAMKNIRYLDRFVSSEEELKAKNELRDKHGIKLRNAASELERIKPLIQNIEAAQKSKDYFENQFQDLRQELFQNTEAGKEINKVLQAKVQEKFAEMVKLKGGNLASAEEAQKYFDKLMETSRERGKFSYVENEDLTQKEIDKRISFFINGAIQMSIKNFVPGKDNFDRLSETLQKFIDKQEVGSRKKEEAKKFIAESLQRQLEKLSKGDLQSRGKAILLAGILVDKGLINQTQTNNLAP